MRTVWLKWRTVLAGLCIILIPSILYYLHSGITWDLCSHEYQADEKVKEAKAYCNFPDHGVMHGQEGELILQACNYFLNMITMENSGHMWMFSSTGEVTSSRDGSKLNLISVHAVIRHGDRDNLHTWPNYENPKLRCTIEEDMLQAFPVLSGYVKAMEENEAEGGRREDQTFHGYDLYPKKSACSPGLLTPEGAMQHILNGELFKQKYQLKHNLLKEDNLEETVLVRSTLYPRTFQSSLALLFGFLPKLEISKLKIQAAANNTLCTEDTGHSCYCPMVVPPIDSMSATFRQMRKEVLESSPAQSLYQHLAYVLETDVRTMKPAHIMDVSMVHLCHNLPLPKGPSGKCMQPWAIHNIYKMLAQNGQQQISMPDFNRIARLKFQPLMHEIAERMLSQAMGKTPVKFALYGGHDTTIEPLAAALNFSGGIWSRYASRIVFELYAPEGAQTSDKHSIRVLYNGAVVTKHIPFCKDSMTDAFMGLCPLDHFIKFVRKGNLQGLGEQNYTSACLKFVDPAR